MEIPDYISWQSDRRRSSHRAVASTVTPFRVKVFTRVLPIPDDAPITTTLIHFNVPQSRMAAFP